MKLSDISCPDFKPVVIEGKSRCLHFLPSGGCDLRDRCHEFLKAKGIADEKLYSHSQLNRFISCRRSYWHSYIEGIQAIKTPKPLRIGSCGHRALAWFYRGRPWDQFHIQEQELDMTTEEEAVEATKLSAMYEAYVRFVPNEDLSWRWTMADVEKFAQGEIAGRKFIAYYDVRPTHNGKPLIVDHKITGDAERSIIADRDQICTYLYLDPEVQEFALNMLIRPWRMRLKKGEELEEFRERVLTELLAYPRKYFVRKYYYRGEFDLEAWRRMTEIKLEELEGLPREIEFFYPNSSNCRILECEFEPICETGVVDWELYKKKGMKR